MDKISDLQKNDLFYMEYGFSAIKFRVHRKHPNGVEAHSTKWLKSDCIFIKNDAKEEIIKAGRVSKLRAFFML